VRRFLIGLAGGFLGGYTAWRCREALLDRRSRSPQLPSDAAAYGRLRRQLMLAGMFRSLVTLGIVAFAIGPALEPAVEDHPRARRVARIALGLALSSAADLPVDYIENFVLERRYGLSKQSGGDWFAEQLKAGGISLVIALPLLELLARAIERAPRSWPALATAATFPLLIVANVVAPNYIAPLFNRFEPLDGTLERRLRSLAARYGAGDAQILRVDMSRQTEKANAYVTGLFGSHRIVVGDTLISRFPEPAVEFVVAHELGHYASGDVWRSVFAGTAAAGVILFGAQAFAERGTRSLSSATGLARLLFFASGLGMAAGPLLAGFSRGRERAADRFALEATGDARAGIAAFTQLREQNMAEAEQPRWMELLFSSHPSLRRRIDALESSAASST
jgi:STE24 endopeptidase